MDSGQRGAILLCTVFGIISCAANVDYAMGYGDSVAQKTVFGMAAGGVELGVIICLWAMGRWDAERSSGRWFGATILFAVFVLISGFCVYSELQTYAGSREASNERNQDQYDDAKMRRDTARSELVTLRAALVQKGSSGADNIRQSISRISASEKTRISMLNAQADALDASWNRDIQRISASIRDAERREQEAADKMGWSPVTTKRVNIAGYEWIAALVVAGCNVFGWWALVGVGHGRERADMHGGYAHNPLHNPCISADAQPDSPDMHTSEPIVIAEKNVHIPPISRPPSKPKLIVDNDGGWKPKLSQEDVDRIVKMDGDKVPQAVIAETFSISQSTVSRTIKKYKSKPVLGRMAKVASHV